jgi:hypothetical protein
VFGKRGSFLLGHRCREVIPCRMQEVDPLGHPLRIVGNTSAVNQQASRRRLVMGGRRSRNGGEQ